MRRVRRLLIPFLFLCSFPLFSAEVGGIDGRMGMIWYGSSENTFTPSPIKASLGLALPLEFAAKNGKKVEFLPSLDMFFFNYVWHDQKAIPAAIETKNRFSVLHLLLNPAFKLRLYTSPAERLSLGMLFSPSFLFRIVLTGTDENSQSDRRDLYRYFYTGRFFYPAVGGYLQWKYRERLFLTLDANVYLPVVHVLLGDGAAVWDQMMVTASAGIRIPF